jgi:glucoamylase
MHFPSSFVPVISLLISQAVAAPSDIRARDLDSFIASERAIALQGVLNNIGPDGSKAEGAGAGFIIASPSKADPDCKYPFLPSRKSTVRDHTLRYLVQLMLT